jgi:hypothetical protein
MFDQLAPTQRSASGVSYAVCRGGLTVDGVRQTTAVIMAFRKCNKNSLERREGPYRFSREKYRRTAADNLFCRVRSESRCALRLRYVDFVVSIDARGHHFQQLL